MYRLPVFNLVANIWHGTLPPSLAGPTGLPPDIPPDLSPIAQLYLSKYGPGGWFHAWPDDIRITLERAGYITLRCPRDTDVRAPWMPTVGLTWADLDLVEVPANSGRYYVAVLVEQAHAGFPNEYRIAILAQVALTTPSGFPGTGGWVPTGPITVAAGGGGGSDATAVPGGALLPMAGGGGGSDALTHLGIAAQIAAGGGGGSDATAVPGGALVALAGGGGGSDATAVPGGALVALAGGGGGSDATAVPGSPLTLSVGGGGGSDATVSSGGGGGPGSTCAGATLITLPLASTQAIAAGAVQWWRFAGTAGTRYHIQMTINSGSVGSGHLDTGACGSQTPQANTSGPFWLRDSFVLGFNTDVYIEVRGDAINAGNYTIDVGTGP